MRQSLFGALVEDFQYLLGDVMTWAAVDHFLNHDVVLFVRSNLFHCLIRLVQDLLQLFIATAIQVFLEFTLLALEIAILLGKLFLACGRRASDIAGASRSNLSLIDFSDC